MKTYKYLYGQVVAFEILYWAYRKAWKGKRDQENIASFKINLETNLLKLQDELEACNYKPGV
jgi:hypothetical protein